MIEPKPLQVEVTLQSNPVHHSCLTAYDLWPGTQKSNLNLISYASVCICCASLSALLFERSIQALEKTLKKATERTVKQTNKQTLFVYTLTDFRSAVAEALADLRDAGVIPGWRNEMYPVTNSFHEEPCMLIERAAAVPFGIKASTDF